MKLVLFEATDGQQSPGLLTHRGVVRVADAETLEQIIDSFDERRADLERLAREATAMPLDKVRLLAPLPKPGKILCSTAAYGANGDAAPLLMTLKSAESVIGPGET